VAPQTALSPYFSKQCPKEKNLHKSENSSNLVTLLRNQTLAEISAWL
jgi:hypothetical protein